MNEEVSLDNFVEKVDILVSEIDAFHGLRSYVGLFNIVKLSLGYLEEPCVKERFSLKGTKGKVGDKYKIRFLDAHLLKCLDLYVIDDALREKNLISVSRFKFYYYNLYHIQDAKNNKDSFFLLKSVK